MNMILQHRNAQTHPGTVQILPVDQITELMPGTQGQLIPGSKSPSCNNNRGAALSSVQQIPKDKII